MIEASVILPIGGTGTDNDPWGPDASKLDVHPHQGWEDISGKEGVASVQNQLPRVMAARVRIGDGDAAAFLADPNIIVIGSLEIDSEGTVVGESGDDVTAQRPDPEGEIDRLLLEERLTDDELRALVEVYPAWETDTSYAIGNLRVYDGNLFRCVQAHTSQPDWSPPAVPALWTATVPADVVPIWVQPTGAQDAYALDDLVTHSGRTWKSLTNANTNEPGVIGTWRDQADPPIWVAPAGAIGLWQVDDVAEHDGQVWICTSPNNAFEPGVFGWDLVP